MCDLKHKHYLCMIKTKNNQYEYGNYTQQVYHCSL